MDRCSALKLLSPRSFLHGDRLTSVSGSIGKMQIFFYGWDYPSWPGSSGNSQSVDFSEMFNWKWEMPWQMLKFLHRNSQTFSNFVTTFPPLRIAVTVYFWQLALLPSLKLGITITLWHLLLITCPLHYFLSLFTFDKLPSLRLAFTVFRY